jgi:CO/xanthine dehydrogenase FAD-binding subunit
MIVEYRRPGTLQEALALLARKEPLTVPLGGGTQLSQASAQPLAVVDLQNLGLDAISRRGMVLEIGAMASLYLLLESLLLMETGLHPVLRRVIEHEATNNLRNQATVAGTLVAADGRSPFAAAFLALDARLGLLSGSLQGHGNDLEEHAFPEPEHDPTQIALGDILPLRGEHLRGRLITQVFIPLNAHLEYEYVARTPADRPIVCAAVASWPSGRTRVVLGGFGRAPVLAMDGPEPDGAVAAARNAFSEAGDAWASAEYRQEMADVLTSRCLQIGVS